jgi:drug/metabolite transporter (DMT)-like permease
MTLPVFLAVLLAALLHAGWNAMVKGGRDPAVGMTAVIVGAVPIALLVILITPTPQAAALPYMAITLFIHIAYELLLLRGYALGDFTLVYPIARGLAPMAVALATAAFGEALKPLEWAGVVLVGVGLLALSAARAASARPDPRALIAAAATGLCIAGYTICDGMGARASGSPLAFYGYGAILNALALASIMALRRQHIVKRMFGEGRKILIIGANASFVAYAIASWAFTQAPVALVSALRETSILFALLIGVLFLGEKLSLGKATAALTVVAGIVMMRLATTF